MSGLDTKMLIASALAGGTAGMVSFKFEMQESQPLAMNVGKTIAAQYIADTMLVRGGSSVMQVGAAVGVWAALSVAEELGLNQGTTDSAMAKVKDRVVPQALCMLAARSIVPLLGGVM